MTVAHPVELTTLPIWLVVSTATLLTCAAVAVVYTLRAELLQRRASLHELTLLGMPPLWGISCAVHLAITLTLAVVASTVALAPLVCAVLTGPPGFVTLSWPPLIMWAAFMSSLVLTSTIVTAWVGHRVATAERWVP